jgi:hypothetical protein
MPKSYRDYQQGLIKNRLIVIIKHYLKKLTIKIKKEKSWGVILKQRSEIQVS